MGYGLSSIANYGVMPIVLIQLPFLVFFKLRKYQLIVKKPLQNRFLAYVQVDKFLFAVIIITLLACDQLIYAAAAAPQLDKVTLVQEHPDDLLSTNGMDTDYRIGPHDLLEIEVFRVEEFSRTVRVNSRGSITLPLLGVIKVKNLSSQELELNIAERLAQEFLQQPHVSVFIKEYASQRITVEGEVKKPGIFALTGRTTLLQAIALAEGLTDLADLDEVQLFRKLESGDTNSYILDIGNIRTGEIKDPIVVGNDIIVVHRATVLSFIKRLTESLRGFVAVGWRWF